MAERESTIVRYEPADALGKIKQIRTKLESKNEEYPQFLYHRPY